MNKKTVDSDTSSDNVNSSIIKSSRSLTGNTKMFILPPNVLQNICMSDSIAKGGHIISALEFIKKDNTISTITIQENKGHEISTSIGNTNSSIVIKPTTVIKVNKIPTDNTDSESLINATEVPKINTNEEKLMSKTSHTEQVKKDLPSIIEKQKTNGKVDNSVDISRKQKTLQKIKCTRKNLENNETTSNDVPKPQKTNIRSGQSSSEKYLNRNLEKQKRVENKYEIEGNSLGRSKRIRKQTNFDDYITTHKKESLKKEIINLDIKRKSTRNKDKKKAIISNPSLSDTTKPNNIFNHVKGTKEELEDKNNERTITTLDSHTTSTSITPAVTKKSLPLNSSDISGNHSNMVEQNDKSGNKVHIGSMNTSVLECAPVKETDVETTLRLEGADNLNSRGRGRGTGRGSSYSTLDIDYIPKLKGPIIAGKTKEKNSDETIANTEEIMYYTKRKLVLVNLISFYLDFENDIKLWRKVLMNAIKKRRGKLSCEKCETVKHSANGFISHMQFCGKSDEEKQALLVNCPICGAVMMPSSMEIHERSHRQSEESKLKELQYFSGETEKVKRKAAEKAMEKILEFTESLVEDSSLPPEKKRKLEPSLLKSVIRTPEQNKSIPAVWKEDEHVTVEGIDKNADFEEEYSSSEERTSYRMNFLNKEQHYKIRWSEPYLPTVRWTMEFERKNYKFNLFNDYLPNHFTLLNNTDVIKYLPELEVSVCTKQESSSENTYDTEIPWKQWKRFEGGFDEGTSIFFTGGPVWALAWLPIPSPMYSKEPYQYVAISTHPTMESEYTVGKSYSGHNMIQIWNVGPLSYETDSKRECPALSYAIAHNTGTIWCLEWCPSGCYQDESLNNYKEENETESSLKRMGMLAAACSDGNVHIYSLPFPEELKFKKTIDNEWPIYCTDPIITLVVNLAMYDNNDQNWQCTKLSWTKEQEHNTIAAGFSNGYIALWDLTYKSPLSIQKRQNTYFINAFQHFYAHGNAVSMVALVPYNGKRFLASGSLDRLYKFWNLDDTNTPQTSSQKGIILDGAWMTHWPCAVICFDDGLKYKHTNTYLLSLRDHEFKYYPILGTNSPAYTLAVSDYANSIAHGTLAGEIISIFAHELVHSRDIEKAVKKKRKLSSFIKIVDFYETKVDSKDDKKDKENSNDYKYMPETYNQCQDRFGIIFCDNLKDIERHVQQPNPYPEKLTTVPIEEYPFMSVNRISWNPNAWSYLWMVAGYQNGLVRLLNFKYKSMSRELKALLPHHVKSLLNKANITTKNVNTKKAS
ncbi:General transcription factor 3C polypeptide 2 [Habropoda laboriosa]|uniref:General transcription factor 3C polypeptide 2 n=1 Tax=Habropoda laboriosa TaxID=597456 RepID=A0A0L7RGK1_9HYME|nr:General transcription factor 3C polypeptide 2 [Habropoda laboriosa]